jgi:hypothetical protein
MVGPCERRKFIEQQLYRKDGLWNPRSISILVLGGDPLLYLEFHFFAPMRKCIAPEADCKAKRTSATEKPAIRGCVAGNAQSGFRHYAWNLRQRRPGDDLRCDAKRQHLLHNGRNNSEHSLDFV